MKTGFRVLICAAVAIPLGLLHANSSKLKSLLENPPFLGMRAETKPAAPATNQNWELRGVVVEGGVAYITIFELSTKKWTTLQQGVPVDGLVLRSYDLAQDSVVLESAGKMTFLALKSGNGLAYANASVAVATAAALKADIPVGVPPVSRAESHRFETVAKMILQKEAELERKNLTRG